MTKYNHLNPSPKAAWIMFFLSLKNWQDITHIASRADLLVALQSHYGATDEL